MPTEPTIVIRQATRRDRPAIDALNAELQAYEIPMRPSRAAPDATPADYVDEIYARRRQRYGDLLVATKGRLVIGFIAFAWDEDLLEQDPKEIAVTDMIVAAAHRRQGVGKALMQAVETVARTKGISRLTVATLAVNTAAQQAYGAMGFGPGLLVLEKRIDPTAWSDR